MLEYNRRDFDESDSSTFKSTFFHFFNLIYTNFQFLSDYRIILAARSLSLSTSKGCILFLCEKQFPELAKALGQYGHWYGLAPVCWLMWNCKQMKNINEMDYLDSTGSYSISRKTLSDIGYKKLTFFLRWEYPPNNSQSRNDNLKNIPFLCNIKNLSIYLSIYIL